MLAVRKIEVRFVKQTPLDVCLDLWMRWQSRGDIGIGWHRRSANLHSEAAASSDELYDRIDNETGTAMDTMIGDLSVQHNWAIKRRCGVATVWRFPLLDFVQVLPQAEEALEKKMRNNIATRNYFV